MFVDSEIENTRFHGAVSLYDCVQDWSFCERRGHFLHQSHYLGRDAQTDIKK